MKLKFSINGISDDNGKLETENMLSSIVGVKKADIDLESGEAVVETNEDIGLDVFAAAVEEAGYNFVWDKEVN